MSNYLKDYVTEGKYVCPICGSTDPDTISKVQDGTEYDPITMLQKMHCDACDGTWTDVFDFAGAYIAESDESVCISNEEIIYVIIKDRKIKVQSALHYAQGIAVRVVDLDRNTAYDAVVEKG